MSDSETVISWVNIITGKTIERTIPDNMFRSEREDVEKALHAGQIVCLTEYNDVAFVSNYIARAENMAQEGETLLYPNGRVVLIKKIKDD